MSLRGEAAAISRINLRDCFVASAPRNDADLKLLQLCLHPKRSGENEFVAIFDYYSICSGTILLAGSQKVK